MIQDFYWPINTLQYILLHQYIAIHCAVTFSDFQLQGLVQRIKVLSLRIISWKLFVSSEC